jgi:hypothetical protein
MANDAQIDIIADAFARGTPIDEAVNEAARDAVRLHRKSGLPMASWEDGKVVWVSPFDVDLPEDHVVATSPPASGD